MTCEFLNRYKAAQAAAEPLIDTPFDLSTHQGIFDHVATRLIAQGRPSMSDGFCAYRGDDDSLGCACAAGHLIPNDRYSLDLEGQSLSADVERDYNDEADRKRQYALHAAFDPRISRDAATLHFVRDLQNAHDATPRDTLADWLAKWRGAMRKKAVAHGLSTAVLEAV